MWICVACTPQVCESAHAHPEHWEGVKEFLPGKAKASRGQRSGSNVPEAQAEGQKLKREPGEPLRATPT